MKIHTRLILAFLVVVGLGFYKLADWTIEDLRPRYLETMEESMVDTATLLSALVGNDINDGTIRVDSLRAAFENAKRERFAARIYELTKTHLNLRVYVTDAKGTVLFDSDGGKDEGKDYSTWNDVVRTLRGEYGARTTRTDPDDPGTAILYVASPIRAAGATVGVLTVCKPQESVTLFMESAKRKIIAAGIVAAAVVGLLGMIISSWVTSPIRKLTAYANAIRDGERVVPPGLGRSEIGELGAAFEEMRDALEGKQYVEKYVQTLTHEIKSPLSAIRGAAELADEDMDPQQRKRFLENIRTECSRIQDLVVRLLELSALETRKGLGDTETIDLRELLSGIAAGMQPVLAKKQVTIDMQQGDGPVIKGERFLVRQALANLLQNAADFSPTGGKIRVTLGVSGGQVIINIVDDGPGVPQYALGKVFDRFYSLTRPDTGKKSSGLGLTFVQEVAILHGGTASIENTSDAGARVTLTFPAAPLDRIA